MFECVAPYRAAAAAAAAAAATLEHTLESS